MDKLNYGEFDTNNTDIAFTTANGYLEPSSEQERRRQLSYPLKEVKTFVNNTVSVRRVSGTDSPIQLVLSSEDKLQYAKEPNGTLYDLHVEDVEQKPYSFEGMVVMGTNLTTEAKVKEIYGNDTSWTLLSSVILGSEHVFGNGKSMAWTNGENLGAVRSSIVSNEIYTMSNQSSYGQDISATPPSGTNMVGIIGSPTKVQLGEHLDYSGLIADTKTVYSWERTA